MIHNQNNDENSHLNKNVDSINTQQSNVWIRKIGAFSIFGGTILSIFFRPPSAYAMYPIGSSPPASSITIDRSQAGTSNQPSTVVPPAEARTDGLNYYGNFMIETAQANGALDNVLPGTTEEQVQEGMIDRSQAGPSNPENTGETSVSAEAIRAAAIQTLRASIDGAIRAAAQRPIAEIAQQNAHPVGPDKEVELVYRGWKESPPPKAP